MKKMLAVVLSLVTVFVLGTAVVFAAKHHNSAQVTTIADIKANGWDEQRVLVDGEFTEHIYKDLYTFTDNEGNEYYYNIHYDKELVIVPDKKEKFHPDVISSEEATNHILNATNNFFNSLDSEDLEIFKKELENIL